MTRDGLASSATVFTFSCSLSASAVAMPLLGLAAGYSPAVVGALIGASGLAQLTVRLCLGLVMRHVPDRTVIIIAGASLAVSNLVVVWSAALVPFLLAQLLQGAARACFWTGSQTHVVRRDSSTVNALAGVSLSASVGTLVGPYAAGLLAEHEITLALQVAAALATVAAGLTLLLAWLPPFDLEPGQVPRRIWRRPGVGAACWVSVTTGAWRGMLGSFIPIALQAADHSPTTIGALISITNVALLIGSGVLAREWLATWHVVAAATVATGAATALVGFVAGSTTVAAVVLAISGVGAGVLQTLAPALATESVEPQEVGEAIIATGTFRAAALFAGPLTVAGALSAFGLTATVGLAGIGALIVLPAITVLKDR